MGTGANGHLAIWGKWAHEKNGHQEKWAQLYGQLFTGANGYLGHLIGQTRTLRPMGIGTSRHWGKMGTCGKWAPGNMSTRANRYLRQMGTLEHNGHLGTDGHWG